MKAKRKRSQRPFTIELCSLWEQQPYRKKTCVCECERVCEREIESERENEREKERE